jgi:deazaflavin-dependent oxidoreductase (nitroreductase family)
MPVEGIYEPSSHELTRDQVAEYEASGGQRANTLRDTGIPIIIVTMRGRSSGKLRKIALVKVCNGGRYALIASWGGRPANPVWYNNLVADPNVMIQDGAQPSDYVVRLLYGVERDEWFRRGGEVYPKYMEYQANANRVIPIFLAEPA